MSARFGMTLGVVIDNFLFFFFFEIGVSTLVPPPIQPNGFANVFHLIEHTGADSIQIIGSTLYGISLTVRPL
jgi:hypothetical protein